jgi:glyoxylase-like metal-dependent hydrolase (beta-lactamase superfamily II)
MIDVGFVPVTANIYKLDLPNLGGWVPVGVWLVRHERGWTVVDAGSPGFETLIIEQICRRTGGVPPTRLVFTHGHADHGAAAEKMVALWGLPVAAGRAEIPYLLGPKPYRRVSPNWWGYRLVMRSGPSLAGRKVQPLDDGMIIDGMLVIHAPGHSPGMIALLHREDRALLTGDVFLHNIGDLLGQPMGWFTPDPAQNRRSMRKLAALDFDHLLTSHGPPIMGEGKARAQACVDHMRAT